MLFAADFLIRPLYLRMSYIRFCAVMVLEVNCISCVSTTSHSLFIQKLHVLVSHFVFRPYEAGNYTFSVLFHPL